MANFSFNVTLRYRRVERERRVAVDKSDRQLVHLRRRAATIGLTGDVRWALSASHTWGSWARRRDRREETVEAYGLALAAARRYVQVQLVRRSTEAALRQLRAVHVDAAEGLTRGGRPAAAATALDQGRAVLLTQRLELDRVDLDRLAEVGRGDLVERFRISSGEVARLVRT